MIAKEIPVIRTTVQKMYSIPSEEFFAALGIPHDDSTTVIRSDWTLQRDADGKLLSKANVIVSTRTNIS